MDIFMVVVIFLVFEAAICAICSFVCRERRTTGEQEKQSKKTSHNSTVHPPHITHGIDHHKGWSHAFSQQPKESDDKMHLTCFPPRILP
jgi:hypothetical protein